MARIAFVPNDPMAVDGPPLRRIAPLAYPAGSGARVDVRPSAPAAIHPRGTPEFAFWQTRTALIRGLHTWRALAGSNLASWQPGRVLPVRTNAGDDLNAFYDRASLQFFSHRFGGRTVHSCESADVVNHEQGHAFLDAIRPDFWDAPYVEVGALHEAFGDCFALLVALGDATTRRLVLAASPDLALHNFLERLAEELGDAIRREFGAQEVEPGALRRAQNVFRWADPTTLPANAPASQLSREVHSFSRVFTGAFYDVIRNVFAAGPRTSTRLRSAALAAGRLLLAAIRTAPLTPRLFAAVGQRMLQADVMTGGSAHAAAIRAAFAAHGIALAAPTTSLATPLARSASAARRALCAELGAPPGARLELTPVVSEMHGAIAHVAAWRPLRLATGALAGLHVPVPAAARVQTRGVALVGLLGDPVPADAAADREARAFANGLLASGQLALGARGARTARRPGPPTHGVEKIAGRRTLVRRGFACCGPRSE